MTTPTEILVVEIGGQSPEVVLVGGPPVVHAVYVGPESNPTPVYIPGSYNPSGTVPVQWFAGDGPPPNFIPGARPGDMYVDQPIGRLYQL
jgi:hypothetical protein